MAVSKAQIRANLKFRIKHCYVLTLTYHKEYDKEVIAKLKSETNKTDYIRKLILKDLEVM